VYSSSIGLINIFIISLISHWTVSILPWFLIYINIIFVFFEAKNQFTKLPSESYVYYIIYILVYLIIYLLSSILTSKYHSQNKELQSIKDKYNALLAEKESLDREIKEFNSELDISSKIQRSFYPRSIEISNEMYDIYAYSKSYNKISGDYFDIIKNNKKIYFGIGDVTGHGMSSAIISVIINIKFKTYVKLGVNSIENILNDLQKDLLTVNNKLMTISIGYIDENAKIHLYGNQEIPILVTHDRCRALIKNLYGFILGNSSFNVEKIPYLNLSLNKNEFIILYTDGLTEIENKIGESFGVSNLIEYIENNKNTFMKDTAKNIARNILSHIREWSKNSFKDDTTLLIIKRK
jgi:sigma-B regulation protein RsbU (phosphoserine phosphatase)